MSGQRLNAEERLHRVASFGTRLKEERERRKISLEEISASTKISPRLLHALEDDHFELLPGGIFNKGFIRAYAQYLGLDEEQAVADYLEATGTVPAEPKSDAAMAASVVELRAESGSNDNPSLPWGLFAVLLLVAALAFAVWGFYSRQTATVGKERVPTAPSAAPVAAIPAASPSSEPARPAMTPVSTATRDSPRVVGGSSAALPSPAIVLRISAREDSWVSITADGKRILQDTLTASEEKSVQAAKQITLRAGNIAALDLEWNGKKIPPQGTEGDVITLSFDAAGWHVVPKPPPAPESPSPL